MGGEQGGWDAAKTPSWNWSGDVAMTWYSMHLRPVRLRDLNQLHLSGVSHCRLLFITWLYMWNIQHDTVTWLEYYTTSPSNENHASPKPQLFTSKTKKGGVTMPLQLHFLKWPNGFLKGKNVKLMTGTQSFSLSKNDKITSFGGTCFSRLVLLPTTLKFWTSHSWKHRQFHVMKCDTSLLQ